MDLIRRRTHDLLVARVASGALPRGLDLDRFSVWMPGAGPTRPTSVKSRMPSTANGTEAKISHNYALLMKNREI